MAAPFFNKPFQPYVYQSPDDAVIPLQILGGEAQIVQPDAFLCSVSDVKVSNAVDQRIRNIPDGVEVRLRNIPGVQGFLRQKLSGRGLAFIVAGDSAVQKILEVGEVLAVDVTCIAAISSIVNVKIQYNAPTRRAVFGRTSSNGNSERTRHSVYLESALPSFISTIARSVASPNMREHPKLLLQLALFFLGYVVILSSFILTDA